MTANLLTLNSSKTEFLLICLKKQLAKIHNSSLDTSHCARNLGFICDEHLTFSGQMTSLSKACHYHIRQLRCIRLYLDSSTACATATFIVHSKRNYCNSLYSLCLNYPVSSRSRTLLLILSLKLPCPVILELSRRKTYLFHNAPPRSFTSSSQTASMDYCLDRFFWASRFIYFFLIFVSGPCARLSWPSRQLLSAR